MRDSFFEDVVEAERLLEEVRSWSEEEVQELPRFYRDRAREFRQLMQQGEE